ncbi:MAG: DUF3303 domain-containing protein [Chloroflexota bacterium]
MLFHITHVHTPETCPYHKPEKARATFGKMLGSAEQLGVKLVGAWVDAPAHILYIVVETDSAQKIEEFLAPGLEIGCAETRIVQDGREILKRRAGTE